MIVSKRTLPLALILGGVALACASEARAESPERAKHVVYAEFFGTGLGLLGNYEYLVLDWAAIRGGVGSSWFDLPGMDVDSAINVALSASLFYRLSDSHSVELIPGVGVIRADGVDAVAPSVQGGWRYQWKEGGPMVRLSYGRGRWQRSGREARSIGVFGIATGWAF